MPHDNPRRHKARSCTRVCPDNEWSVRSKRRVGLLARRLSLICLREVCLRRVGKKQIGGLIADRFY